VVSSLLFVLSMAIAGAASAAQRLFPPFLGMSRSVSSLLVGAIIGGALAVLLRWASSRLAPAWSTRQTAIRLVNALLVAMASTWVGIAFMLGLGLWFPRSPSRRLLQGVFLIGSAWIGLRIGFSFVNPIWQTAASRTQSKPHRVPGKKLLDTSIIIDGRISHLVSTGFIEGEILVPEFVLSELQSIADSSDSLRRRKGRRGLDILNDLIHDESVSMRILAKDYPSIREVDRKLIHLAKDEGATLITTDFNLNRVARVEDVPILNVNELANAVKPRFIPGETLSIEIIDRGEEINQGIGYLDDGTMVVVENGRRHIGRTITAIVKSALQTEAGRMLFVEPSREIPQLRR